MLPMFCFDDSAGRPCLTIEPPIPIAPGRDRVRAMADALTKYARMLESYVTRYPAQYRGWHLLAP